MKYIRYIYEINVLKYDLKFVLKCLFVFVERDGWLGEECEDIDVYIERDLISITEKCCINLC